LSTRLELTNTERFCITRHEMRDNVFAELKTTVHFTNRSGVGATCPDCHVPHDWTDMIARKMQASKEVWGHLFGRIDTPDKFAKLRRELAEDEWARLKANNSLECRHWHSADSMHHPPGTSRRPHPPAIPVHRATHLHRLPQGHRPSPAGCDRRAAGLGRDQRAVKQQSPRG
jgi:nitrate/TMAO reductase-like tetraheme cytochrome c subunit